MTPADAVPASSPAQLTFGLRFVAHPANAEAPADPGGTPMLQNVVALPPQLAWLCQRAANGALLLDAGTYSPQGGYPVAPFATLLDGLLAELVDPGVFYTSELFLLDHIIKDGQWIRGLGHMFRVLANGAPLVQETLVGGVGYDVEILVSVQVVG